MLIGANCARVLIALETVTGCFLLFVRLPDSLKRALGVGLDFMDCPHVARPKFLHQARESGLISAEQFSEQARVLGSEQFCAESGRLCLQWA